MITKDITVEEMYLLEKVKQEVNQTGKEVTSESDDIFEMANASVSRANDVHTYDTDEESCDGSKDFTPGSNDMYQHETDI